MIQGVRNEAGRAEPGPRHHVLGVRISGVSRAPGQFRGCVPEALRLKYLAIFLSALSITISAMYTSGLIVVCVLILLLLWLPDTLRD